MATQMNNTPMVSVIMPVYNLEKYVSEAIDSIIAQTYTNWELIIVNDGSKDRTAEIVRSYTDLRIVFIDNAVNKRKPACLNQGIAQARGKYFMIMDGDDRSRSNRIEVQLAYMEQHSDVLACGCQIEKFGVPQISKDGKWPYAYEDIYIQLLNGCCMNFPIVNIERYHALGLTFDENMLAEDYLMWIKMADVAEIVAVPDVLLDYRVHDGQISIVRLAEINTYVHKERNLHFANMYRKITGEALQCDFFCEQSLSLRELQQRTEIVRDMIRQNVEIHRFDAQKVGRVLGRIWYRMVRESAMSGMQRWRFFLRQKDLRKVAQLGLKNYAYMAYCSVVK